MKKKPVLKKLKGFTLIELIIYMGLMGIFLVILTDLFVATLKTQLQSESNAAIQQDGRFIINRLNYDIKRAKSITAPAWGNTAVLLQLVVNIDGIDQTFHYSQSADGNLVLSNNIGTNQLNSYDTTVTDLTILHLGNPVTESLKNPKDGVQIKFSLKSKVNINNYYETKNFQTTVNLR